MPEPVRLLAGEVREVGPNHVAADERRQAALESRLERRSAASSLDRAAVEDRALDRGRGRRCARSSDGKPSRRAASSAWIVEGTGSVGRGRPTATQRVVRRASAARRRRASPRSSSAKSGLPSAASAIRASAVGGSGAASSRFEISCRHSAVGERLEQDRRGVELAAAPAGTRVEQLGSRDAEEQDRRRRARRSATCSTRSRNVGSAQWTSSNTTTSGPLRASASKSFRTAQKVSSLVPPPGPPSPERLGDALGDQLRLRLARESRRDRRRRPRRRSWPPARADVLDDLGRAASSVMPSP